ncbi:hypothetical protein [Bradyrhizobium guangzhouense]|uniref:hypothetical protein n=1 Tax=Bradyrhizobium guangzhouense TaxID=1325095 RepID=UPI001009F06E|nr:hypothetical protein [Bradyrhizobium guangzhouense]RXH11886.1 hypothetical protein EAS54_27665 [Bradyrhizobium guangzhouense]
MRDLPQQVSSKHRVTAEIRTGSRTILGYLLSPLQRYRHEITREPQVRPVICAVSIVCVALPGLRR